MSLTGTPTPFPLRPTLFVLMTKTDDDNSFLINNNEEEEESNAFKRRRFFCVLFRVCI